jgi:hypothetical protein
MKTKKRMPNYWSGALTVGAIGVAVSVASFFSGRNIGYSEGISRLANEVLETARLTEAIAQRDSTIRTLTNELVSARGGGLPDVDYFETDSSKIFSEPIFYFDGNELRNSGRTKVLFDMSPESVEKIRKQSSIRD